MTSPLVHNKKPVEQTSASQRRKSVPHRIYNEETGTHFGGSCLGCGNALEYWLHFRLCDRCLHITPGSVWQA